jgi:hypothetical protein
MAAISWRPADFGFIEGVTRIQAEAVGRVVYQELIISLDYSKSEWKRLDDLHKISGRIDLF